MNTKTIIYDDSCPMCAAYTQAFIQTGLIQKEGRQSFSKVSPELMQKIDLKRAVNEIPLIDSATSQVWYGIDALLEILQQKIPFAKLIANIKPVKWLLLKLYKFISYNRRVIVAGSNTPGSFDCTPDFNIHYRVTFLLAFWLVNSMLLFPLNEYVLSESLPNHGIYQLQAVHALIVLFNLLVAARLGIKTGLEYLGQVTMFTLIILSLTVPLITLHKYTNINVPGTDSFYFGALALFGIQEYRRRMNYIAFIRKYPVIILLNLLIAIALLIYILL